MAYFSDEIIKDLKQLGVASYVRKSTKDTEDKQIRSIEGQITDIQTDIISKFGLKNVLAFKEEASAFETGRKEFDKLIESIIEGKVQIILCWHPNRLARNYQDAGTLVHLMSLGLLKYVITPSMFFEYTPRDKEYLMGEFTRAARDSDDKSLAVHWGNKNKFYIQKEWGGPAKPGYINLINPITNERYIGVDSARWAILRNAFEFLLTGRYTRAEVLFFLNEDWGFRTRQTKRQGNKPLSRSAFYRIVNDPFYYGLMIRKISGKVAQGMGNHKPMLTKQEFDKLQVLFGSKKKSSHFATEAPFKEILKCGGCGGSVTFEEKWQIICGNCKEKFAVVEGRTECPFCKANIEKMKNKILLHYLYYRCTRKLNPRCTEGTLTLAELEATTKTALDKFEISPKLREWAIEYLHELTDIEINERQEISSNVKSELTSVEKRLDSLLKTYTSPENADRRFITPDEFMKQKQELLSEKDTFQNAIVNLSDRQDKYLEVTSKAFDFACYARYWFEHGDAKTKGAILNALGSNLTIKDRKLCINGEKAWYLIEKGKQQMEAEIKRLEPSKSIDVIAYATVSKVVLPIWLGDRDSVTCSRLLARQSTPPRCRRNCGIRILST